MIKITDLAACNLKYLENKLKNKHKLIIIIEK